MASLILSCDDDATAPELTAKIAASKHNRIDKDFRLITDTSSVSSLYLVAL